MLTLGWTVGTRHTLTYLEGLAQVVTAEAPTPGQWVCARPVADLNPGVFPARLAARTPLSPRRVTTIHCTIQKQHFGHCMYALAIQSIVQSREWNIYCHKDYKWYECLHQRILPAIPGLELHLMDPLSVQKLRKKIHIVLHCWTTYTCTQYIYFMSLYKIIFGSVVSHDDLDNMPECYYCVSGAWSLNTGMPGQQGVHETFYKTCLMFLIMLHSIILKL